MDIKFRYLPDSPPVFNTDRKVRAARWAAARADYLAGASAAEVCERHGLKLSTFRLHARQGGWRRADQPAPFIAPDPATEPAPAAENDPAVSPETPAPLTAVQMADKAWAMLQAAMAAGRLIEARGWMRLYKDLKPFAREEADTERRARMDRQAAETRESFRALRADREDVGLPLDGFSRSESNTPNHSRAPATPSPSGWIGGSAHADKAEPGAVPPGHDARAEDETGLQLHCFSRSESDIPGPGP